MDDYKRHVNFNKFALTVTKGLLKHKFNYSFEPIGNVEGPCLVLCNHNSDLDCLLLAHAFRKHMYFVVTEKVTRMGLLSPFLKYYFDPILHSKGLVGIKTTMSIIKHIKKGHSVALFPEGNRSFNGQTCPIPAGTGKLAKASGATLVTYRIHGGYLTTPRWSDYSRKGKMYGQLGGIYTPDMLKNMTDDEVQKIIETDLFVDAYEDQKINPIRFTGKNLAKGLESSMFVCPICKKIGTLRTEDNIIKCSCGFKGIYDEYGYINTDDGKKLSLTDWDRNNRNEVVRLYKNPSCNTIFEDEVKLEIIDKKHEIDETKNLKLSACREGLYFGEEFISMSEIEGIGINQKNLLMLHIKGRENHYECCGNSGFSALKYLYLIREAIGSTNGVL